MPRKTGYTTRSAASTLTLGDPELGTNAWYTEYDQEFVDGHVRQQQQLATELKDSARARLRTPRSLKKGYVYEEDYERLDDQYASAVSAYRDLQLQMGALEQRLDSMRGSEEVFLQAVEDQHVLVDTLRQQVAGLTDSLGRLLGGVERNRSLMAVMNSVQESPPAQVEAGKKLMHNLELNRRLASLESKIGDMAEAITTLSRSNTVLASRTLAAMEQRGEREADGGRGLTGNRRSLERFERLPNPVQYTKTKQTFWKP